MPGILIVGGLTIDRFADGSTAPGGSVIHAGVAAAAMGERPSILTVAGDEPEARIGLEQLAALGPVVRRPSPATTRYRHDESGGRRVLVYEAASAAIPADGAAGMASSQVLLVAPIADELAPESVTALRELCGASWTVLLIQGWLRELHVGDPVEPLTLDQVPAAVWAACSDADAVVVSAEDFRHEPPDPFAQLASLRRRAGTRPILVVTLGPEGWALDDPAADRIVAAMPRRVISGVPTVGAGDTFGAAMALRLAVGDHSEAAAAAGTERVIALLESRLA